MELLTNGRRGWVGMLDTPLASLESRSLCVGQGISVCLVKQNKHCIRANTLSLQKHLYFCASLFFQQVSPTDSSNTASSILATLLAGTRTLGCPEVQGSDCHHLPRATSGMHKIQMWNTNIIYHYGLKFTFDFQRNPNTHF